MTGFAVGFLAGAAFCAAVAIITGVAHLIVVLFWNPNDG